MPSTGEMELPDYEKPGEYFWRSGREGYAFQLIEDNKGVTHLRVFIDGRYNGPIKKNGDIPETEECFYVTPNMSRKRGIRLNGLGSMSSFLGDQFTEFDDKVALANIKFPIDYSSSSGHNALDYSSSNKDYIAALFRYTKKIFR